MLNLSQIAQAEWVQKIILEYLSETALYSVQKKSSFEHGMSPYDKEIVTDNGFFI